MMPIRVVPLDPIVTITIIENSITTEVIVPLTVWDRIEEFARSTIQLDANGVDYGFLSVTFGGRLFVIQSETMFTKYEAVSGDVEIKLPLPEEIDHQILDRPSENEFLMNQSKGCIIFGELPFTVFDHPTQYPSLKLILHLERGPPESGLPSDLLQLYRSQENTDVTFSFGSKELKAHKSILGARSDYFRRMFSAGMKENQTGVIEIVDFDPEVFEEALIFLYSGFTSKPLDRKLAMSLLPLTDKYLIESLKKACLDKSIDQLQGENVSEVLALATELNCVPLRDACFRVMKTDMAECKRWVILLDIGERGVIDEFLKTIDGNEAEDATD